MKNSVVEMGFLYFAKKSTRHQNACFDILFVSHRLQLIQNGMSHFCFGHDGEFFHVVSGDQGNDVGVGTETGAADLQVIGYDHIGILLRQLRLRILVYIIRFRGKSNNKLIEAIREEMTCVENL